MTQEHPITPPPELVQQWLEEYYGTRRTGEVNAVEQHLATQAANWGADQQLQLDIEQVNQAWQRGADHELEACCEWLQDPDLNVDTYKLRAARRPKPPSVKEQALELVDRIEKAESVWAMSELDTIRRALESLPD